MVYFPAGGSVVSSNMTSFIHELLAALSCMFKAKEIIQGVTVGKLDIINHRAGGDTKDYSMIDKITVDYTDERVAQVLK